MKGVPDRNAPLQQVVMLNVLKPKPQPLVTERLQYLLQKRRHLHVKARRDSASGHRWLQYRAVRREGTLLNQQLKLSYYKEHFIAMKGNPRGQWSLLNRLSGRAKSQESPKADIGELSATFQEFVTDLHRPSVLDPFHGPPASSAMTVFTPFAHTEDERMLRCLNTDKACGSDGLPPYLLTHCSASLAQTLIMIINESLATATVPDIFKLANVCPFTKMVIPMTPATTGQSLFCLSYQSFLRKWSTDNWLSTCSTPPTSMVFLTNSLHTDITTHVRMHSL